MLDGNDWMGWGMMAEKYWKDNARINFTILKSYTFCLRFHSVDATSNNLLLGSELNCWRRGGRKGGTWKIEHQVIAECCERLLLSSFHASKDDQRWTKRTTGRQTAALKDIPVLVITAMPTFFDTINMQQPNTNFNWSNTKHENPYIYQRLRSKSFHNHSKLYRCIYLSSEFQTGFWLHHNKGRVPKKRNTSYAFFLLTLWRCRLLCAPAMTRRGLNITLVT